MMELGNRLGIEENRCIGVQRGMKEGTWKGKLACYVPSDMMLRQSIVNCGPRHVVALQKWRRGLWRFVFDQQPFSHATR